MHYSPIYEIKVVDLMTTCVEDTKKIVQVLIREWVHWIDPFMEHYTVMWYPMLDSGYVVLVVWLVLRLETPRIPCVGSPFFDFALWIWFTSDSLHIVIKIGSWILKGN